MVGASDRADSLGSFALRNLVEGGFTGRLDLVNPRHEQVSGRTCRARIADLALSARLPAISPWRDFVLVGGLMGYDTNVLEWYRRAGYFVDRILKGTKPADLPVEQPTKADLTLNMKTAQVLGLTIPPSVLAQATEVIQ